MLDRHALNRREWLARAGGGIAGLALTQLLAAEGLLGAEAVGAHHPPKAKRVVQLFMSGAASQVDLFDYKPELQRRNGQPFDPGGKIELFQSSPGPVMAGPAQWSQHGQCGRWVSSLVPRLAECVDDMAFIHSMTAKSNVHGPATFLQNTGFLRPGFPSMGAWISYALGSENDDLPTFVVLPDERGFAPNGTANWSAGFLPAQHQGTMIRPALRRPIFDLELPEGSGLSAASDQEARQALAALNEAHRTAHPGDSRLDARIAAYELAARLQLSAPEALDLSRETQATRDLYGLDDAVTADFGRNCLIARRLLERGVRCVQVYSGADNGFPRRNWDSHEDLARDHGAMAASMDRPAAALLKDLKARGLLDETLVIWTTEFGRMPCSQGNQGRDHNPDAFTCWLAGGGVRGGVSYGASDEWSYRVAENPTEVHDVHATALRLLGFDHTRLTVRHDGIDRRLTDVHGAVIESILA